MSQAIISVEDLGKRYQIRHQQEGRQYVALRDVIAEKLRAPFGRKQAGAIEDFWALKDVSFDVKQGEVVGIIGRNGAGKSTLLKVLSRITEPTTGRVRLRGRVASLLEVGTGFHPELTGRENIFLNGAILGMTRSEIARKFDEIVAFAEIEQFLDTPVKRYSSGMYVRLAFAVAAHLDPEILIVDEVLAVGDSEFQKKCLGKMRDVSTGGRTVLFVSHNMSAVQALCSRAVLLDRGRLIQAADVPTIVSRYVESARREASIYPVSIGEALELRQLTVTPTSVRVGEPLELSLTICARHRTRLTDCCLLFQSQSGVRVAVIDLREGSGLPASLSVAEEWSSRVRVSAMPFVEGVYHIGLYVVCTQFAGDVVDVGRIDVSPMIASRRAMAYAAAHRGFIEMNVKYVHSNPQVEVDVAQAVAGT